MKILKRNQIIISVIALMLITVGYLNYSSNISKSVETSNTPEGSLDPEAEIAGIGDARLVNGEVENQGRRFQSGTELMSQLMKSQVAQQKARIKQIIQMMRKKHQILHHQFQVQ